MDATVPEREETVRVSVPRDPEREVRSDRTPETVPEREVRLLVRLATFPRTLERVHERASTPWERVLSAPERLEI